MLDSRRHFLQQGFYAPLAEAIANTIRTHLPDSAQVLSVLDAGCGEGYYLGKLAEQLGAQHGYQGTDIFPVLPCVWRPNSIRSCILRWLLALNCP